MENFSVAAVFSNHMVLQRNKNITVFGYGSNNTEINAALYSKQEKELSSNKTTVVNGRWELKLSPQKAQEGCTLIVNNISFTDISIGEVWLAGGQSNMEYELQNAVEGPEEFSITKDPKVRFYYTNKIGWKDDAFYEAEKNTSWQTWESEGKKSWSAVGYFFAKQLTKDLGCTVGLIGCNWGGTSASAWMRKEYLEKDEELRTYLTEQEEAVKGKSLEEQCKEYDDYVIENDKWQAEFSKLYEKSPGLTWEQAEKEIGKCPWPGPKSCKNPYRPTGLYDCMLSRIIPYTIKGVIWYQGESDDHKPNMYAKLFSNMIDNWRTDWNDNSLPFIFVQLPCHRYMADKDFKHWCLIREAQQKTADTVKNAFMTCALELGQFNDIHPRAKKVLGIRMEKTALVSVYKKACGKNYSSPALEESLVYPGEIKLKFINAEKGFICKEDKKSLEELIQMEELQNNKVPQPFTPFEVAGKDGIYYPAEFKFGTGKEKNTITVCSKKVPEPQFARYAWYNYGPVMIFGKNNLPLQPFRTCQTESTTATEHAKIQQVMTVNTK